MGTTVTSWLTPTITIVPNLLMQSFIHSLIRSSIHSSLSPQPVIYSLIHCFFNPLLNSPLTHSYGQSLINSSSPQIDPLRHPLTRGFCLFVCSLEPSLASLFILSRSPVPSFIHSPSHLLLCHSSVQSLSPWSFVLSPILHPHTTPQQGAASFFHCRHFAICIPW